MADLTGDRDKSARGRDRDARYMGVGWREGVVVGRIEPLVVCHRDGSMLLWLVSLHKVNLRCERRAVSSLEVQMLVFCWGAWLGLGRVI